MLYARDFLGLCYSLLSARSHFHLTDDRSLPFRRQSFKIESQNHLSPQDLGVLATRHSAIPIDRFSYHSLGSSPITWNKFLIHPEDRHLAERLAIHLTQLLIPSNENANHEVRSFSRNTWRATNFCKSVLVFDLDLKK